MFEHLFSIGLFASAVFFSLLAASRLVGLLLRIIDRLSIDREDVSSLLRNMLNAIGLYLLAYAADRLPLLMTLVLLVSLLLAWQLVRINRLLPGIQHKEKI